MTSPLVLCWLPDSRAVETGVIETAVPLDWQALGIPQRWTPLNGPWPRLPIGPFPLRVALAVPAETCEHRSRARIGPSGDGTWACNDCGFDNSRRDPWTSAIVAVGTLTEDGHHADECRVAMTIHPPESVMGYCSPHVGPDTYHYAPSGVVTLDPPVPAERDTVAIGTAGTPLKPICGSLDTEGAGPCVLSPPIGDGSAHVHHGAEDVGTDYVPVTWQLADDHTAAHAELRASTPTEEPQHARH